MDNVKNRMDALSWPSIGSGMNARGYALIPGILSPDECDAIVRGYGEAALYRKTISMERYRFGAGEYKYFAYPLPDMIQEMRENMYPRLAPVANGWMQSLHIGTEFPDSLAELQRRCRASGQDKPTVLILKYGTGGHNTLHQDLYGAVFFPIQLVLFLSEPDKDYTGGEFVLTQQTPRAQSKAIVLKPRKGDMLLFTTNFRPVKGTKGYYRANMKHGVSELHSGERYTLGIIFHDAQS